MRVLVTGGTGYIGSHTCVELLNNNNEVVIIDNLSNSEESVVNKIEEITHKNVKFYHEDCRDKKILEYIFKLNKIDDRREGDIAVSYANPSKANTELNWYATHNLEDMCKDSYNYAVKTLKLTK